MYKTILILFILISFAFPQYNGWNGWGGWNDGGLDWPYSSCSYLFAEDDSTIAHWWFSDLNDSTALTDLSGNGHDLTASMTPSIPRWKPKFRPGRSSIPFENPFPGGKWLFPGKISGLCLIWNVN